MEMDIGDLNKVLTALSGADPFTYSDPESVIALERASAVVDCLKSRAVASFDASGEWAVDGAQNTTAWLSTRCHLPVPEARRQLRRGRALPSLPLCAEAFAQGEIGVAHVDLLVKAAQAVARVDDEAFARDEALLVQAAKELKFGPFSAVVSYWSQLADPDGAEESEMEKRARRDVFLVESMNAMWLLGGTLDPVSGEIVSSELLRLESELFEADWAEAKARLCREPRLDELSRTPAQRRADALVEMATRSKSTPADARRPEPLFSVLIDYPTLSGRVLELASGGIVSPGAVVPWLDQATFERIIFAPGKRVECSVTARFFTGATRRAIVLRDRTCTHEYCEVPAERCEIDHIVPYAKGGPTDQENGQLQCGFHNRLRNHQGPDPGD
jgi:hypothetical protein